MGKTEFIQDQAVIRFINLIKDDTKEFDFVDIMLFLPDALRHFMHFYSQTIKGNGRFIGCNFFYCGDTLRYRIELIFTNSTVEVRPMWVQRLGAAVSLHYDFIRPIHISADLFGVQPKFENLTKEIK